MQESYVADRAIVVASELYAEDVMKSTPIETVKSILGRLGIEYEQGLVKEAYIAAFKEEFCSDGKWILLMLPKVILDFLMEVWDNDSVEMNEDRWNFMEYLKIFGLLTCRRGNPVSNRPNELLVVQEMRDNFYFLLKSRKSKKQLVQYEEWEKLVAGFMYYYGLMETGTLYAQFVKIAKKVLNYEDFVLYLKCRCSLWAFGVILQDAVRRNEYFQYFSVENPELLLVCIREHPELPYKKIKTDDLIYVSESAGIDNRWPGVSDLGNILVNNMGLNYYRATVLVKTLVIMIQNGASFDKLTEKMKVLSFESEENRKETLQAVRLMFENVPVFEYKGYSRKEYKQLFHEKQVRKKKESFTIIDGGKE